MPILMGLNENNSEKVCYDIPHYPVYIRRGLLSHYLNYSAPNHWHDDIELIAVLSGEMEYSVNGEILALKKGQGLLVNAGQMHFGFSRKKTECDFICILLHPMLLSPLPSFEQDFILPVIRNQNFPYLFLHEETSWERAIYENQDLNIVKKMAEFINNNYMEKLSLADIAAAGAVGQSKCCKLFARFFFQTPTMYLTQHRLTKSMELLLNTDLPVIEIALSVGFGSASYYTETFRKWIGKTPSEFPKQGKFDSQ